MTAPPLWTAAEAARAAAGQATGDFAATGVSIDTRSLVPGDLFVALADARDGHDFVAQALARGAAAALVSRRPAGLPADAPLLVVPDVLEALRALGRAGRARSRAQVVAVTGSVGKTSTKEMLRTILAGQGRVHAAEASYNNHWGVPLTLARLPQDAEFAVIEIGMNHPGEIAPLAAMTRPHAALITTIAPAHLEAFADIDGIAREKATIFGALVAPGTAVLPSDVPTAPILVAGAGAARIVRFGAGEGCDWRLVTVTLAGGATVIQAVTPAGPLLFKLSVAGRHFAANALGALAAAAALGADPGLAAADIARWLPPSGRGTREDIVLDIVEDHLRIGLIDDAFNANPVSVAAALEVLAASAPTDGLGRIRAGRRIAVLGDMLELGPDSPMLHANLAGLPAMAAVDCVHCVGIRMQALWQALPETRRGEWHETAAALAARAHLIADAGDVVLVKGSKGSRVSVVVDALRKLGQTVPSGPLAGE